MTTNCCSHCHFVAAGKRARAEAEKWKSEHLTCIAAPIFALALEMEAMAVGEPKVCLGEAPRRTSAWLKKLLDP